jgi:hypothetical protein
MQENNHVGGMRLMQDDRVIPARGSAACVIAYHAAAVEFWQEIELLRAQRDELLAACKKLKTICLPPLDISGRRFLDEACDAIARAEGKETT